MAQFTLLYSEKDGKFSGKLKQGHTVLAVSAEFDTEDELQEWASSTAVDRCASEE